MVLGENVEETKDQYQPACARRPAQTISSETRQFLDFVAHLEKEKKKVSTRSRKQLAS